MVLKLGALKTYSCSKPNNELLINYILPAEAFSSHLSKLDRCQVEGMLNHRGKRRLGRWHTQISPLSKLFQKTFALD